MTVRGWCPTPRRPMLSGDGLLVRVRPRLGRLTPDQLAGLAAAALAHGSGWVELTARLSLQLRGVRDDSLTPLTTALEAWGLIDPDPAADARPAVVVAPFAEAAALHDALAAALADAPALPPKIGVALDPGPAPALSRVAADVRIERDPAGRLLVVADGEGCGRPVSEADAPAAVTTLLRAFAETGARRVAQAALGWGDPAFPRSRPAPALAPGAHGFGLALGLPFGRARAEALAALAPMATGFRLAPGRVLLALGAADAPPGFVVDPADPRRRLAVCPGAPHCASAEAATLDMAEALAARLPAGLWAHVSGCAKGCAHPAAAPVTLVGRAGRFDLVRDGRADATPARKGLTAAQALEALE